MSQSPSVNSQNVLLTQFDVDCLSDFTGDSSQGNNSRGKLIIFEGVEGCGKTTQVNLTADWLRSRGFDVVVTREPGGTDLGIELRKILLDSPVGAVAPLAELLLYAADRAQHVERDLKPQLEAGKIILCDRFIDSTVAYQGFGRGLDLGVIEKLNAIATAGLERDLVLWLDIKPEVGLQRKQGNKNLEKLDRIEQEKNDFHHRVRHGYQVLAENNSQLIYRFDGNLSPPLIQSQIQAKIQSLLGNGN